MRPIRPPTPPEETEPIMIHISREEFFRLLERFDELAVIAHTEADRIEEMLEEEIDYDDLHQRRVRDCILNNMGYIEDEVNRVAELLMNHQHYLNE